MSSSLSTKLHFKKANDVNAIKSSEIQFAFSLFFPQRGNEAAFQPKVHYRSDNK